MLLHIVEPATCLAVRKARLWGAADEVRRPRTVMSLEPQPSICLLSREHQQLVR
jgi:hypothetical protein